MSSAVTQQTWPMSGTREAAPAARRNFKFWLDLERIAKKHGCRWGGDWKGFRDVAHIEFWFIESPPPTSALV